MGNHRQSDVGDCPVEHRHGECQPDADHGPVSPRNRQAVLLVMLGRALNVHVSKLSGGMPNELQRMRMLVLNTPAAAWGPPFAEAMLNGRGSGPPTVAGWRSLRASPLRRP